MEVINITRKFTYNGISLGDPNPGLSVDAVREFYATQYPELNNAVIEGPVTKGHEATYKFLRAVGDKGAGPCSETLRSRVVGLAKGQGSGSRGSAIELEHIAEIGPIYQACMLVVSQKRVGRPLQMPSQAFGIWG